MAKINPIEPNEMIGEAPTHYPYGTELKFEGDIADQLNVDSFKAGEVVKITAMAFVKEKSEESDDGKKVEKELCLQLTDVSVVKSTGDRAAAMYKE